MSVKAEDLLRTPVFTHLMTNFLVLSMLLCCFSILCFCSALSLSLFFFLPAFPQRLRLRFNFSIQLFRRRSTIAFNGDEWSPGRIGGEIRPDRIVLRHAFFEWYSFFCFADFLGIAFNGMLFAYLPMS